MTEDRIYDDEQYRDAICDWLRANDINPNDVPSDADASLSGGVLTIPLYLSDENGRYQVDPYVPNTLARHTVTVPVKVPPTPEVLTWLSPIYPTCGR